MLVVEVQGSSVGTGEVDMTVVGSMVTSTVGSVVGSTDGCVVVVGAGGVNVTVGVEDGLFVGATDIGGSTEGVIGHGAARQKKGGVGYGDEGATDSEGTTGVICAVQSIPAYVLEIVCVPSWPSVQVRTKFTEPA